MLADRLVAHRGYQKCYPENTLLSVTKAIEAGAHNVEIDVLFSSDKKAMLYHDVSMQRVSNLSHDIHQLPLATLTQKRAYEPERLGDTYQSETISPLSILVPLLKQFPHTTLFVEAKPEGIEFVGVEHAFAEISHQLAAVSSQCVLISYDLPFLLHARKQGWPSVGVVLEEFDELFCDTVKEIAPDYAFCLEQHAANQDILNIGDTRLVIFEVDDPDRAIQWFRQGADLVETFDIGGMLNSLAHRAL